MHHFFRDKQNRVVIFQFPNWPLWLAILLHLGQYLSLTPRIEQLRTVAIHLVLFYWAYLEIRFGVNQWRKLLGWMVVGWLIWPG